MPSAYEVIPYDIADFTNSAAHSAGADIEFVSRKSHFAEYFKSYFAHIGAKTIVVEHDYMDHDFLEDFAAYYVRCFPDYRRKCARFHFFSHEFDSSAFEKLLGNDNPELTPAQLQEAYLGFVVIKPLPQTIVGRTCLRTYGDDVKRHFPVTRQYSVNLFGIPLEVKTLAFQEQDSVVAACATSALWSAFQCTDVHFHHPIPSPAEITRAANASHVNESRYLPNSGLNIHQMAHAVRNIGLEPYTVSARDESVLKNTLYGYLRGHVPAILVVKLFDSSNNPDTFIGLHAVAVSGYRLGAAVSSAHRITTVASQIDTLYAHDDGVGPFARMRFDGHQVYEKLDSGAIVPRFSLSTSWQTGSAPLGKVRMVPELILVPLYHKIRISFEQIQAPVIQFHSVLEFLKSANCINLPDPIVWDLFLTTVNDFKKEVFSQATLDPALRLKTLSTSLPRFIWRASARSADQLVLDLLFDATDIAQGSYLAHAVAYDSSLLAVLQAFAKTSGVLATLGLSARAIFDQLRS